MRCAARCGALVAEERGLAPEEGMRQALTFLHRQARMRVCALNPEQARQEAIAIASLRSQMGIVGRRSLQAHQADDDLLVTEAPKSSAGRTLEKVSG